MKALRGYLRDERGVERELLSISGYWRRGLDEEGFRADKQAGNGVAA
jgi:NADPH-dependent ferric siderophore reductase